MKYPRTLTTHLVDLRDDGPRIHSDRPGRYRIDGPDRVVGNERAPSFAIDIRFQTGPVPEAGVNGATVESLLAVAQDRLEEFQGGAHPCRENQDAIGHIKAAMAALHKRTIDRRDRNVEGKMET